MAGLCTERGLQRSIALEEERAMYDQLVGKRQRGKRGKELDKSGDVQRLAAHRRDLLHLAAVPVRLHAHKV